MSINLNQQPNRDLKKGKFYVVDSNNKKHYFGDATFTTQNSHLSRRKRYYARHYHIKNITTKKVKELHDQAKQEIKNATFTKKSLSSFFLW